MKFKINLCNTLTIILNILFIISFNANSYELSDKVAACTLALNKGDLASAVTVSAEILKLEPNNHEGLLCKGRALGAQGKYNEALSALELAATNAQTGFDQIISYIFIGNLHKANNKNAEAIASYEKSLKACDLENNQKFKRITLNLIAEAQIQNNDLNAALINYLAGAKLANNDNERADSYERLAATYSTLGQYDSAIEYQLKGVLMQQKAGTLDQYANASSTLGQIYGKAKDYANAEKTYTKLIQFAKDNGGAYYEAKADYDLAQVKALSGDTDGAKIMMADALTMAKNIGERDLATEIEASMKKLSN